MDAVYSINMQDIDGFHQLMPRSFGQRTQLDKVRRTNFIIQSLNLNLILQIHAQDPEDLLSIEYPPIPSLPNHHKDNLAVLSLLKENALSYK